MVGLRAERLAGSFASCSMGVHVCQAWVRAGGPPWTSGSFASAPPPPWMMLKWVHLMEGNQIQLGIPSFLPQD